MTTEMINANDELTLDQLDDVNGGFFAWLYAAAVDATLGEASRTLTETMDKANASANGVMATPDGRTDGDYDNPFNR